MEKNNMNDYVAGIVIGTIIAGLISAIAVYSSKQDLKIEIPKQDNSAIVEVIKALSTQKEPANSTSNGPVIRVNSPETYNMNQTDTQEDGVDYENYPVK